MLLTGGMVAEARDEVDGGAAAAGSDMATAGAGGGATAATGGFAIGGHPEA